MTREEAEKEFDLVWAELVAEGSIKHMGDDKWIVVDNFVEGEEKENDQ